MGRESEGGGDGESDGEGEGDRRTRNLALKVLKDVWGAMAGAVYVDAGFNLDFVRGVVETLLVLGQDEEGEALQGALNLNPVRELYLEVDRRGLKDKLYIRSVTCTA